MSIRDDIVKEAKEWIGTPFKHRQCLKQVGADCGMLPIGVYSSIPTTGVTAERPKYSKDWYLNQDTPMYLQIVQQFADEIDTPPLPGDFLLFQYGKNKIFAHGAIVIDFPKIIHAYKRAEMVIEDDLSKNLDLQFVKDDIKREYKVFRLKGL